MTSGFQHQGSPLGTYPAQRSAPSPQHGARFNDLAAKPRNAGEKRSFEAKD